MTPTILFSFMISLCYGSVSMPWAKKWIFQKFFRRFLCQVFPISTRTSFAIENGRSYVNFGVDARARIYLSPEESPILALWDSLHVSCTVVGSLGSVFYGKLKTRRALMHFAKGQPWGSKRKAFSRSQGCRTCFWYVFQVSPSWLLIYIHMENSFGNEGVFSSKS